MARHAIELESVAVDVSPERLTLTASAAGSPEELRSALCVPMGDYGQARKQFGEDRMQSTDIGSLQTRFQEWAAEACGLIMEELGKRVAAALSGLTVGASDVDVSSGGRRFDPPDFLLTSITTSLAQAAGRDAVQGMRASVQQAVRSFSLQAGLPSPSLYADSAGALPEAVIWKADVWDRVLHQVRQHFASVSCAMRGHATQSLPIGLVNVGSTAVPVLRRGSGDYGDSMELWTFCTSQNGVMTMTLFSVFFG